MCRNHLLGEHRELHTFVGTLKKGISIDGYIRNNCLELPSIILRHEELVEEMKSRGWNHYSPLEVPPLDKYEQHLDFRINREASLVDLLGRCPDCRRRYNENL
jgi:hypothetical protein